MHATYGRDLDLNLLRVFVAVADAGSATAAAARLYITQPAISAALKRLSVAVGAPLFIRRGRGLALTARGARLLTSARPHLEALVDAALAPATFDAKTSARTFRLGLSDASESWLLPPLVRALEKAAPKMRIVAVPVQFRTVADALRDGGVDAAVTVADALPAGTRRERLYRGRFVCLFDPRHAHLGARPSLARYLEHEHVIVSYNGDLRGVVEDVLGIVRTVRCSVSSFHSIGPLVDGTALVATVPAVVAADIVRMRPHLRTARKPFHLAGAGIELLWPASLDDDPAFAVLRRHIRAVARRLARG